MGSRALQGSRRACGGLDVQVTLWDQDWRLGVCYYHLSLCNTDQGLAFLAWENDFCLGKEKTIGANHLILITLFK